MQEADLIDQFASLVLGAEGRLGQKTLEVVVAVSRARSAAILRPERGRLSLFASTGIDQTTLDAAEAIWTACRKDLENGEAFYARDLQADKRFKSLLEKGEVRSAAVVPVLENGSLLALLYADSTAPGFCDDGGLERLGKFGRIVAKALGSATTASDTARRPAGEQAPLAAPRGSREELLLALRNHEWNIARAARVLGVTRRTIYLRLARFGVKREKMRKGERRLRPQSANA